MNADRQSLLAQIERATAKVEWLEATVERYRAALEDHQEVMRRARAGLLGNDDEVDSPSRADIRIIIDDLAELLPEHQEG